MHDFEDIQFWGCNIPKELEEIMERTFVTTDPSFDNDNQREAYRLGVENTISLLKQVLNSDLRRNSIVFYYPDTNVTTEMLFDEVLEWVSGLADR